MISKSYIFHNCFYLGKKGVPYHPGPKRKKKGGEGRALEKHFQLENKPTESRERFKGTGEKRCALKSTNVLADSHPWREKKAPVTDTSFARTYQYSGPEAAAVAGTGDRSAAPAP